MLKQDQLLKRRLDNLNDIIATAMRENAKLRVGLKNIQKNAFAYGVVTGGIIASVVFAILIH